MYWEICWKLQLNPVVLSCCFNLWYIKISMQFLHTVLYTFPKVFTRRVCPSVNHLEFATVFFLLVTLIFDSVGRWCLSNFFSFYSADCVDLDLGMKNERISDGNITASSTQNASTPAKNGRLNYTSGSSWCSRPNDTNPYLQIDLQTFHIICAVSTQGNSQADHWVKNYTLQFSNNGTTWMVYRENGQIKVPCQRPCHLLIFTVVCKINENLTASLFDTSSRVMIHSSWDLVGNINLWRTLIFHKTINGEHC